MALTILYDVTRSADFKSISIVDGGTTWGVGGEMSTGDVTAIELVIYGTDKDVPLKTVTFTSGERSTFLAGTAVTLLFSDSRLWSTTFPPDNFYTSRLHVTGGTVTETYVAFDSYFYAKKLIMDHMTDVSIPIYTLYEANKELTGDLAAINQLEYLSSVISIDRENKWRKIYNFIQWNYNIV
jgi:hypothetical protein